VNDQEPDVRKVLELAQGALTRFETAQLTIRDWANYKRICEVQDLPWDDASKGSDDRETRLWVNADRKVREELDTGQVRLVKWTEGSKDSISNWPLLDGGWLSAGDEQVFRGAVEIAGRRGNLIDAGSHPADFLLPGANRCKAVIDSERGVVLRCEALLGDELLMVEEIVKASFDEALDPGLFAN
jgi:hypothetical protein